MSEWNKQSDRNLNGFISVPAHRISQQRKAELVQVQSVSSLRVYQRASGGKKYRWKVVHKIRQNALHTKTHLLSDFLVKREARRSIKKPKYSRAIVLL